MNAIDHATLIAAGRDALITTGKFVDGRATIPAEAGHVDTFDPADGSVIASIPICGPADVDAAVQSSKRAFESWRRTLPSDRARILLAVAAKIREASPWLAPIESMDSGKPLREAIVDVEVTARYFEFYAGAADKMHGETLPLGQTVLCHTLLEPVGVTAHVIPWNFPLTQAARGVAPALAAGCTAVVKPAEQTPLTALLLARLLTEAGVPDGVCNVICGSGPITGAALVAHKDVDHVVFTGSVPTGKAVMKSAADHIASVTLELGGKSPVVVLEDADMDSALAGVMRGIFRNCGQVCSAGSRLVLQRSVAEKFLGALKAKAEKQTLGRGLSNPDLGPLVSELQRDKVAAMVERAIKDGAEVVTGAKRLAVPGLEGGYFYPPTLLKVNDPDSEAAQDEFFGPILAIQIVEDFDQAIAISNQTKYGLAAGIYTSNITKANIFAREVSVGQVYLNGYLAGGVETPFGGMRSSGFGREKGIEGLRSYLRSKTVITTL